MVLFFRRLIGSVGRPVPKVKKSRSGKSTPLKGSMSEVSLKTSEVDLERSTV